MLQGQWLTNKAPYTPALATFTLFINTNAVINITDVRLLTKYRRGE